MKCVSKNLCSVTLSVLAVVSSMTACASSNTQIPDVIAEYQVPFAEMSSRWNEVVLIERDKFGRELYSYKSEGSYTNVLSDYMDESFSNAPVIVYLIAQKSDDDFVYCYENLCYEYVPSLDEDNTDIVKALKDVNDWGKPIDDSKLTALSIDIEANGVAYYKLGSVEQEVVSALEKELGHKIESYYLDCIFSASAEPIYILREVEEWVTQTTKNRFGKSYIFIVSDRSSTIEYRELPDEIQNWNEEIDYFLASAV